MIGLLSAIIFACVASCLAYFYKQTKIALKKSHERIANGDLEINKYVQEIKKLEEEITALKTQVAYSLHDPVTRFLTKESFENHAEQVVQRSMRYQFTMGFISFDLNDFNLVQAVLSDKAIDQLLQEIGKRLKACIREVDNLSRFDKANFVILLSQLAKPETAALVAQRIMQEFTQAFHLEGEELHLTVSVGIALCPMDGQDVKTLLKQADQALQRAKEKGQNQYQFYQKEMHEQSQREMALYASLNYDAITNVFSLSYEPIHNSANKKIIGLEALLVWPHPQYGIISAEDIYSIADKQNKLALILEWLLEKIGHDFSAWQESYPSLQFVAITLPLKFFTDHHFIYRFTQWITKVGFEPNRLLIQIKGNFSSYSLDMIEKTFNRLDYLGVRIAIDDFGVADFPLRYLAAFRIDYVKLDISQYPNFVENKQDNKLLTALILLAHTMDKQVIAKCVNNQLEAQKLESLNCLLMQGDLFEVSKIKSIVADHNEVT